MRSLLRLSFILAIAFLSSAFLSTSPKAAEQENARRVARVVIIGVDGAGAFFKDADMPNLRRVMKNGAVTYKALTSNPTISAECWGSMLHGVAPEYHGLINGNVAQRPYPEDSIFPSVFRVIRENSPDASLASIVNWDPINFGIVENNLGVVKEHGENDSVVTDLVCQYLEKNDPTFLFVHFDECDGAGHSFGYGSEKHLAQLHTTDGYIQRIYETLERRGMIDSTLFIVTADHGGTNDDGNGGSHGGWSDEEKFVMIAATGPGVAQGEIQDAQTLDLSAVVLYALGLADKQPETWTSRVPSGLFKGVTAKERPVVALQYFFEGRAHETEPTPTGDESAVAAIGADRVPLYLPLDGNVDNAIMTGGRIKTTPNGKLYFVESGSFGKCARFDDGWIAVDGWKPGVRSFSVAFWMRTGGADSDPAILSNKDWENGINKGFILSLKGVDLKFNVSDGQNRFDEDFRLPPDFRNGWVYVVFVVDRQAGQGRLSYDFGPFMTTTLPDEFKDLDFDAGFPTVNIGQDATGQYEVGLGAELDEFILVDGVLTDEDVASLKGVYLNR